MASDGVFDAINEAKADMEHIYNQPDPRAYFRELEKLGYAIPGAAKPIFQKLISHLQRKRASTVHVLDLGCSYGVNAALLKHDLSMSELYQHWGQDRLRGAEPADVVAYDQRFFAQLETSDDVAVTGLDLAENAVDYAAEVGLLDEGLALNLESQPLPKPVAAELAAIDLVTSTGCVGYVTEKTFERLLPAVASGRPAWLANFVLRMFPFDAIEAALARWGYVTEKLEGEAFIQRRFASSEEQQQVIEELRRQGLDPAGLEAEGCLLAEFYLSRPADAAAAAPLHDLLAA